MVKRSIYSAVTSLFITGFTVIWGGLPLNYFAGLSSQGCQTRICPAFEAPVSLSSRVNVPNLIIDLFIWFIVTFITLWLISLISKAKASSL